MTNEQKPQITKLRASGYSYNKIASYTGTMILQKNYTTDGHVRKMNNGELPRFWANNLSP